MWGTNMFVIPVYLSRPVHLLTVHHLKGKSIENELASIWCCGELEQ